MAPIDLDRPAQDRTPGPPGRVRPEFPLRAPTIPIPFHKLLKIVALVDADDPQTRQLLEHIAAEGFEVERSDRFDRDISEDAAVGAYIACVDGDERRERSRTLAR